MGQKVNPHGLRVGVIKNWDSRWFAEKGTFGDTLVEDYNVRNFILKELNTRSKNPADKCVYAGVPKVEIERFADKDGGQKVRIHIHCAKPGIVIGRGGAEIEKLRAEISKIAGGKDVKKKDLASIAMSYGYVYVAQIAMGADFNQTVKAIAEAEAYPGPSLIIAYAPCINHGIKKGMSKAQTEEQLAVECGYWNNFRFNPEAEKKFTLDSKEPKGDYQEFLNGEVRYNALMRANPEKAQRLFAQNEAEAMERYEYLKGLVNLYDGTAKED